MNGQGKVIWKNGKSYEGNFVDDIREGYGVYKYDDVKKYEGMWKNGK